MAGWMTRRRPVTERNRALSARHDGRPSDDNRLANADRFCPCPQHDSKDSVAAAVHEQAEGINRLFINSREC